jgi:hypothetical protein
MIKNSLSKSISKRIKPGSQKKLKANSSDSLTYNLNYVITNLDTQFDYKYSSIATRQCSWFCHIANHYKHKFLNHYLNHDVDKFKCLYKLCLFKASIDKKKSPDRASIETIFHPNILNKYSGEFIFFKMSYNLDKDDTYSSLPYPNAVDVLNTKKSFPEIPIENFTQVLKSMSKYHSVIINRCIMSFLLIKIDDTSNYFLLIDPHFNK